MCKVWTVGNNRNDKFKFVKLYKAVGVLFLDNSSLYDCAFAKPAGCEQLDAIVYCIKFVGCCHSQ